MNNDDHGNKNNDEHKCYRHWKQYSSWLLQKNNDALWLMTTNEQKCLSVNDKSIVMTNTNYLLFASTSIQSSKLTITTS